MSVGFWALFGPFLAIAGIDGVVTFFPYYLKKAGIALGSRKAFLVAAASVVICMLISLTIYYLGLSLLSAVGVELGAALIICGVISIIVGFEPFGIFPLKPFQIARAIEALQPTLSERILTELKDEIIQLTTTERQQHTLFLTVNKEDMGALVQAHLLWEAAKEDLAAALAKLPPLEQAARQERLATVQPLTEQPTHEQVEGKGTWKDVVSIALFPVSFPLLSGPALASWILDYRDAAVLPLVVMIGFGVVFLLMIYVIWTEGPGKHLDTSLHHMLMWLTRRISNEDRRRKLVHNTYQFSGLFLLPKLVHISSTFFSLSFLPKLGGILFIAFGIQRIASGAQELFL